MDFDAITRSLILDETPPHDRRACPDQYVGQIDQIQKLGKFPYRQEAQRRPGRPAVILILESPHTEEFRDDLGPAKGPTGRNIARFLLQVPGLENSHSLSLVLMNAVQYQCSLGVSTNLYRDSVFEATWRMGGRDSFVHRLNDVFRQGDILVCACTKGTKPRVSELRCLVFSAIQETLPNESILRRTHPVKWHIARNRNYEWICGAKQMKSCRA